MKWLNAEAARIEAHWRWGSVWYYHWPQLIEAMIRT